MRLSHHRLISYQRCPFQYRLDWIDKVPPTYRPDRRLPNALHSALASFHRPEATSGVAERELPPAETLLGLFAKAWGNGPQTEADREIIARGESILSAYYEKLQGTMPDTIQVEASFDLPLGPHLLTGRIDRLDRTPDGLAIVDYKTAETPEEERDTLQLRVYSLAIEAQRGELPARAGFFYLVSNELVNFEMTPELARTTRETLLEMARELEADWRFLPTPGQQCASCPYRPYCPAVTENPRPIPQSNKKKGQEAQLSFDFE